MAALKSDAAPRAAKPPQLARLMREFEDLVRAFEAALQRSLDDAGDDSPVHRERVRRDAYHLAISDFSTRYMRKYLSQSLHAAEAEGKRLEEALGSLSLADGACDSSDDLGSLHNGHFRLFSTELFDLLGQPTQLRFGTLRFHKHASDLLPSPSASHTTTTTTTPAQLPWVNVELALNSSFFVADPLETLPYHVFRLPAAPSLQNRGIRSRKFDDDGQFPAFDSWLLFTFLGTGCIKLEVPIEMCADVYGGTLRGRENEEVTFWGFFVDDDVE